MCEQHSPNQSTDDIEFSFQSIMSANDSQSHNRHTSIEKASNLSSLIKEKSLDDSIEISDDEISNHSSKITIVQRNFENSDPLSAELCQLLFDDDFSFAKTTATTTQSSATDTALVNRSVRDIFEKDFIANASVSSPTCTKLTRTTSDILGIGNLDRHSASSSLRHSNKFREFIDDSSAALTKTSFDEYDEFDQLVHGTSVKNTRSELPTTCTKRPEPIVPPSEDMQFEIHHDGAVFNVKCGGAVSPKPNYELMDSPTRLIELHRFGLRKLPKRQAIICLEHIFNRTHPIVEGELDFLKK